MSNTARSLFTGALERLERAGQAVHHASSVNAAALKALAVYAKNAASPSHDDLPFADLMDADLWSALHVSLVGGDGSAARVMPDTILSAVGAATCGVIARCCGALSGFERDVLGLNELAQLLFAVAAVLRATDRRLLNAEGAMLASIVSLNAHCALDLHWLTSQCHDPVARRMLNAGVQWDFRPAADVHAMCTGADALLEASLSLCHLSTASDLNDIALRKPASCVPLLFVEQRSSMPASKPDSEFPSASELSQSTSVLGHSRGLMVKLAVWLSRTRHCSQALRGSTATAVHLLSACLSTAVARNAIYHRFEDELLLMDNVDANQCRAVLEVLQRRIIPPLDQRKAPLMPGRITDQLIEWFRVCESSLLAFCANRRWRHLLDEKKRLTLARAGSKIGAAFGVHMNAAQISKLGVENALDRLSDGLGRVEPGAVHSQPAADTKAGDLDSDRDSVRETRSLGGYSHMSARTAATTARGLNVVAAVENLRLDAEWQRPSVADSNAHLPIVLFEMLLAWISEALRGFHEAFGGTETSDVSSASDRIALGVLDFLVNATKLFGRRDIFDPIEDTRFNGGSGSAVLEDLLIQKLLVPSLAACADALSAPDDRTLGNPPSETSLQQLLPYMLRQASKQTAAMALAKASSCAHALADVAPAAVRGQLAALLEGASVPFVRPATQDATDTLVDAVGGLFATFARMYAAANTLPEFLSATQNALLRAPAPTSVPTLLAVALTTPLAPEASIAEAVRAGSNGSLDVEGLIEFVKGAADAAMSAEDPDAEDSDAENSAALAVCQTNRAAVVALCRAVLRGVRVTALSALPSLEHLVELDVSLATHVAANVFTRIVGVDEALTAAHTTYDATPKTRHLRAWATATIAASAERLCAAQWLGLLVEVRNVGSQCVQDLGVAAPEAFIETFDATVWRFTDDDDCGLSAVLAAFDALDTVRLVAWPAPCATVEGGSDVDVPLCDWPAAEDIGAQDVAELVRQARAAQDAAVRELDERVTELTASRVLHALGIIGALRASCPTDDYCVTTLLTGASRQATKDLVKAVHKNLLALVSRPSSSLGPIEAAYTPATAAICAAIHPSGAGKLACRLLMGGDDCAKSRKLAAVVSALDQPLASTFEKNAARCLQAISESINASSKARWARPTTGLEDEEDRAQEERTAVVAEAADAVDGLVAVLRSRGSLANLAQITGTVGRFHVDLLRVVSARIERLGLSPRPQSALHTTLRLMHGCRNLISDALRLMVGTARPPASIAEVLFNVFDRADESHTDDAAFVVSTTIATSSVDPDGAAAFVTAAWHALSSASAAATNVQLTDTTVAPVPLRSKQQRAAPAESYLARREAVEGLSKDIAEALASAADTCPFAVARASNEDAIVCVGTARLLHVLRRIAESSTMGATRSTNTSRKAARREDPSRVVAADRVTSGGAGEAIRRLATSMLNLASQVAATQLGHTEKPALAAPLANSVCIIRRVVPSLHRAEDANECGELAHIACRGMPLALALTNDVILADLPAPIAADAFASGWLLACAARLDLSPLLSMPSTDEALLRRLLAAPMVVKDTGLAACCRDTDATQAQAFAAAVGSEAVIRVARESNPGQQEDTISVATVGGIVNQILKLPGSKARVWKPVLEHLVVAALRRVASGSVDGALSVLEVCRLNLKALHTDPAFLELELSLISGCLAAASPVSGDPSAMTASQAFGLVSSCSKLLILLGTTHGDALAEHLPQLLSISRLLVRFVVEGLKAGLLGSTAATVLGSTLFHLSRPTVASGVGRAAAGHVASAFVVGMFEELSRHPDAVAAHSLSMDMVGVDFLHASAARHDTVFGLLRHNPQAQALFRKAVLRIDETTLDTAALHAGGPSRPIAFVDN